MTILLTITHSPEHWNSICQATIPESWQGYTSALKFGGNTALAGEEIRFDGFTRQEVIDRVITELKSRGIHGTLKVI